MKLNGSELFETESCCDYVKIYDGRQSQEKLIDFVTGNKPSSYFKHESTGQTMEIVFKT